MNEFLTEIILAARRRGTEGWMKVLFPVLLALFWVISSILKARAKKAEDEKAGGKQLGVKPGGKPAESITKVGPFQKIRLAIEAEVGKQRQLQAQQRQAQGAQRKIVRPQPAAKEVAAETESVTRIPTLERVKESKLEPPTPQVESRFQKLPEFAVKTVRKLKDMRIDTPVETPQAKQLSEILLDYSDPDELKRAILHYEILGRPLALRDPSGRIIGL